MGDVFIARFVDYHCNESVFSLLGKEEQIPEEWLVITWNTFIMFYLDHHTNQYELKVQKIIYLQNLVNQILDAFIDIKKMTKSYISVTNTLVWIDVHVRQLTNKSKIHLKCGRPVGLKDITPRKRKKQGKLDTLEEVIKMTYQFKID